MERDRDRQMGKRQRQTDGERQRQTDGERDRMERGVERDDHLFCCCAGGERKRDEAETRGTGDAQADGSDPQRDAGGTQAGGRGETQVFVFSPLWGSQFSFKRVCLSLKGAGIGWL